MPQTQASFLHPFSYPPYEKGDTVLGGKSRKRALRWNFDEKMVFSYNLGVEGLLLVSTPQTKTIALNCLNLQTLVIP